MSKVDIAVGDEFPLNESGDHRRGRRGRHGRHGHHHHMHRGHHHHGGRGFGRFAALLVIAGLAALVIEHKLPAEAAYGLIALGLAVIALTFARHSRHHRRNPLQVS
jgi:hypothetical protein